MVQFDSCDEELSEAEERMSTESSHEHSIHQQAAVSSISMSSTMFQNLGLRFREEETHFFDNANDDSHVDTSGTNNAKLGPSNGSSNISEYGTSPYDAPAPVANSSPIGRAVNASTSRYKRGRQGYESEDTGAVNRRLCWRLDPSISLSDWKLQIFNRTTRSFETFHVHRVVLAVGPRASGYFQDVFRKHQLEVVGEATASSRTTRVPLISQACQWIPQFLDYMYGKDEQFDLSYENAMGLLHIAGFFRNQALWSLASEFIEDDMHKSGEHLQRYYSDAVYYDQSEFLVRVLHACAHDLMSMGGDEGDVSHHTHLLDEISPLHFAQILAEINHENSEHHDDGGDDDDPKEADICMTRLVSKFCSLHQNEIPMELFEHFVRPLKVLDSSSALTLLEISLEYDFNLFKDRNEFQDSISHLSFFQRECVGTLSEEWEELLGLDQGRVTRAMVALSAGDEHRSVLVDWFQKTLIRAANQLSTTRAAKELGEKRHDRLQTELKVVVEELKHTQKELEALRFNYATTKTEMKDQISGWVKKSEGQVLERREVEQKWKQEQFRWELDRQEWDYEKAVMNRQMNSLRDELQAIQFPGRGMATKYSIRSFMDDSTSIVTDNSFGSSEQNSVQFADGSLAYEEQQNGPHTFNHCLVRSIDGISPKLLKLGGSHNEQSLNPREILRTRNGDSC